MIQVQRHRMARHVDEKQISAAIASAEQRTDGRIFVTLSPHFWGDVHSGAKRAFEALRAAHPMDENGVLFFVVPSRRVVRVLGGAGIHQKAGQDFWDRVAGEVAARVKTSDLTAGLLHGIDMAGKELAHHYPRDPATSAQDGGR